MWTMSASSSSGPRILIEYFVLCFADGVSTYATKSNRTAGIVAGGRMALPERSLALGRPEWPQASPDVYMPVQSGPRWTGL